MKYNNLYPNQTLDLCREIQPIIIQPPSSGKNMLLGLSATEITSVASFITAVFSAVVAFRTISKYSKDYKLQLEQIAEEKNRETINKSNEKIEKFYGPINSLLEESRVIYEYFALHEKSLLRQNGSYFRTLRFLTEKNNCSTGVDRLHDYDKQLLMQIVDISDKITVIIENNSGFVDNPSLHILLGKLSAHYRIIKLAVNGKLIGLNEELENIVFPLEINGAINSEILKLKNKNSAAKNIEKNKTIRFYDDNYISYYNSTINVDMNETYSKVREHVTNGAYILDAGCGVGRDTRYFIEHGFKVISFDASEKMVQMCNQYPFAYCENNSFSSIEYPPVFDLIWACASLLHLNKIEFEVAIGKLSQSLKQGGCFYFSIKSENFKSKDKREFYFLDSKYLDELFIKRYFFKK